MQMTDSQCIPAPRATVWAALNDPAVLQASIPGCESLEMTSPTDMTAKVVLKIGPVKATFGGKVTLSDLDPPSSYRITGEGSGGVAGFAKGGATVHLAEDGPDATILTYAVDAQVGGKLAQLGSRLIDSTARRLADDFFRTFAEKVAPPVEQASGEATALARDEPARDEPAPGEPASPIAAEPEAEAAPKQGWLKGLFTRSSTTAPAIAILAALALATHLCCLGHAADAAGPGAGTICGVTQAS